ncbi:MAG TPA: glycosyl hydrolase family 18 protein [Candidatus Dormibacteraeota bacterium]|nr:glycosyl hydrolase family 18 protein [Candidatus Dormibacteraeota bacterium]
MLTAGAGALRRCALVVAALLAAPLAACSPAPASPAETLQSPEGPVGIVVVTTGGTALVDGENDVPPTLDLRVSASVRLTPANVGADLDSAALPLHADRDAVAASVAPMSPGSSHTLVLRVPGRDDQRIGFSVVAPGEAYAALHVEPAAGEVLDLAFSLAPAHPADVVAAVPGGGSPRWSDPRHLRAAWGVAPSSELRLPPGLLLDRGSTLAAALDLRLAPAPAPGTLRTALAASPASPPASPLVVAFSVGTAASRASVAGHIGQLSILSPDGLTADGAGVLGGAPDAPAVAAARQAGVAVWPLVQNAGFSGSAVHQLLTTASSEHALIAALRGAAAAGGWQGVHLDLENVDQGDRDALTALVSDLAAGLHGDGRKLAVAVVPHRPGHENAVNAAYDLAAIGRAADLVTLMAYEEHSAGGDPGPLSGLGWDSQILDGSAPAVGDGGRTLLGLPVYARTWTGGDSDVDAYAGAVQRALAFRGGARVDYDFVEATPSIAPLAGGLPATYFDDAPSLARKLALAGERGLRGVALWRLGFEDPALWTVLPAKAARP